MAVDKPLHLFSDTRALRIAYYSDQTKYVDYVATSAGGLTITPTVAAQTITLANTARLSVGGNLSVTGTSTLTGKVTLGTVTTSFTAFQWGDLTSDGSSSVALLSRMSGTLTGASGDTNGLAHLYVAPATVTQTAVESIAYVASAYIAEPNITKNITGTITVAAALYIENAPTEGAANAALYVAAGRSYLGGSVQFGTALVALGGGSAATLGTIGGSGPTVAGQNTWLQFVDSTGATFWVPAWK